MSIPSEPEGLVIFHTRFIHLNCMVVLPETSFPGSIEEKTIRFPPIPNKILITIQTHTAWGISHDTGWSRQRTCVC